MKKFYKGKRIFITGHTGFKGSWLTLLLHSLGATVYGYALQPPTEPSLYELCRLDDFVHSTIADIRNIQDLDDAVRKADPEIVIHMAAQPLVALGYECPIGTYSTNIMGTVNLLNVMRQYRAKSILVVTSDKVYDNREWPWGYRETDRLGGSDPYSSSKACAELVVSAYRDSFFSDDRVLATARAGNVIGGGDWSDGRIVPDCVRAFLAGEKIRLRSPHAVRPWQHVLDALSGYLLLIESGRDGAWNFGPDKIVTVEEVVLQLCKKWGAGSGFVYHEKAGLHETCCLKLDSYKAEQMLVWQPRWSLDEALDSIVEWTRAYQEKRDLREVCMRQIEEHGATRGRRGDAGTRRRGEICD